MYACAGQAVEDTIFTDQERTGARAFIKTTVAALKVDAQRKIQEAMQAHNTQLYFKLCSVFNALSDPAYKLTVWDEHDERQARMTYHNVIVRSLWQSYIQYPVSVLLWGNVHEYMRTENYRSLAYRLKKDFNPERPEDAEHMRKLDTITFLTTFLLNKQFKQMQERRAQSFEAINEERRKVQACRSAPLQVPIRRQRALQAKASRSLQVSRLVKSTEPTIRCDERLFAAMRGVFAYVVQSSN